MDIRLADIPVAGQSLLQCSYPAMHGTSEAILSSMGTVGCFHLEPQKETVNYFKVGKWNRVVITIGGSFDVSGDHQNRVMTTFVNGRRCLHNTEDLHGYGHDSRFSIDPQGFLLFGSLDPLLSETTGICIKYLKFSSAASSAEDVLRSNRVDSIQSQFATKALAEGAKVTASLSLASILKKPYPMWLDPSFYAAFCDPYVEGTGLGAQQSYYKILLIVSEVFKRMLTEQAEWLQTQLTPPDLATLERPKRSCPASGLPALQVKAFGVTG
jgi:hypothetical protein